MKSEKEQALQQTLQALQKRLGSRALGVANVVSQQTYLKTGFPELDVALGGGFPQGRLTELVGKPTSGVTTLTLKTIAAAQQAGALSVYMDMTSTFDPDYATRCGVKVSDVLLVRPFSSAEAFDILFDVVSTGLPGLMVFNPAASFSPSEQTKLGSVLRRLHTTLTRSGCVLLLLSQPHLESTGLIQIAATRLLVELDGWLYEGRGISGYQVRVTLLKHKSSSISQSGKPISLTVDHTALGDGT